jgi:hypothetical protein
MIMTLYRLGSGTRVFTYQARVVADGKFQIPPATVSLMYTPEIFGRSGAQMITLTPSSKIIPEKAIQKAIQKQVQAFRIDKQMIMNFLIGIAIGGSIIVIFQKLGISTYLKKIFKKDSHHDQPPPQTPNV